MRLSFVHIDIDGTFVRAKHVLVRILLQPRMTNAIHHWHATFGILLQELEIKRVLSLRVRWVFSLTLSMNFLDRVEKQSGNVYLMLAMFDLVSSSVPSNGARPERSSKARTPTHQLST